MKIPKSYIGRLVQITWRDPAGKRMDFREARTGKEALATWVERGKIDDISDGVVRFLQSEAWWAGEKEPDEGMFGWVPEDLIEKCELLVVAEEKEHV
jgi:hypothetical protein